MAAPLSTVEHVAAFVEDRAAALGKQPLVVGLVGVPGAGKSTLAARVASVLNATRGDRCVVVPMDGFHLPRSALSEEQMRRRGSPPTFDAEGLADAVAAIGATGRASLPSFDHAVKDPVADQIQVVPANEIVLLEGLYLFLWERVRGALDVRLYLECDAAVARERVVRRHVEEIGRTRDEAEAFVAGNDVHNAETVVGTRTSADRLIDFGFRI